MAERHGEVGTVGSHPRRPPVGRLLWPGVGLVAGVAIGLVVGIPTEAAAWLAANAMHVLVPVFGAVGGLLYAIKEGLLELPSRTEHGLRMGFIGDLAFGVGGGFVVFLVIPSDFEMSEGWEVLRASAVALLGGFSGRALIRDRSQDLLNRLATETAEATRKTGLQVRRLLASRALRFEDYLEEIQRILGKKGATPLSILCVDVDHLRKKLRGVSDKRVLREEALHVLNESLEEAAVGSGRDFDVFRITPGESDRVVLLRSTPLAEALVVAERARAIFAEKTRGERDFGLKPDESFTTSVGIAESGEVPGETRGVEAAATWLARAAVDRLMQAKERGRDRVVPERAP